MRLSEAIRIGARRRPQATGRLRNPGRDGGTCALGAAADALGAWEPGNEHLSSLAIRRRLRELFPVLGQTVSAGGETVEAAIVGLNDRAGWTRERIADRVAEWERTLERAAESPSRAA